MTVGPLLDKLKGPSGEPRGRGQGLHDGSDPVRKEGRPTPTTQPVNKSTRSYGGAERCEGTISSWNLQSLSFLVFLVNPRGV